MIKDAQMAYASAWRPFARFMIRDGCASKLHWVTPSSSSESPCVIGKWVWQLARGWHCITPVFQRVERPATDQSFHKSPFSALVLAASRRCHCVMQRQAAGPPLDKCTGLIVTGLP